MSTKPVLDTASREAQIRALRFLLQSSAVLESLRGNVGGSIIDFFDDCLDQPDPQDATHMWYTHMNDLRIMLETCDRLRREGMRFAELELRRALVDPGYIMAGETVPPAETTPFTVFAVDLGETLGMDKFCRDWRTPYLDDMDYRPAVPDFWKKYEDEKFITDRYGPELLPLFQAINWNDVHGHGLSSSSGPIPLRIFYSVVQAFGARIANINTRRVGGRTMEFSLWGLPREEHMIHYARLAGNSRIYSSSSCFYGKAVQQSELLGAFSPADRERLATWELRLPTAMVGDRHVHTVCIRPEADHARWQFERPQFTSDVAHGHFVTVTPIAWRDRVFAGEELHRLALYQNSRIFR